MNAISLWQPWASLFVAGAKKIETRSWLLRGPFPRVLAVHAAKKWDAELRDVSHSYPFANRLRDHCGWQGMHGHFSDKPVGLGCVVGLVRVWGCTSTGTFSEGDPAWVAALSTQEQAFGNYSPCRYGWLCDRFHALPEPIPCRGHQGLFVWEPPAGLALPEWAKDEGLFQ